MQTQRSTCTIVGTAGDDVLMGTSKVDVICGLDGDDVIRGLGGDDVVYAGRGNDRVFGGSGDDRILGGPGDDRLRGGPGADVLSGGYGDDVIAGGTGGDSLAGGPGSDDTSGGPGDDMLVKGNPAPGEWSTAWRIGLKINYDLPAGSTIKWTYLRPSGNCFSGWGDWTHRADGTQRKVIVMEIPDYAIWESCVIEKSYGTWNYQVTTPSGFSRGGNLYVTSGPANKLAHLAWAECAYTNPGLSCTPGFDSSIGELEGQYPVPEITIGPIDSKT
ncbi:MAG: calcium-binding protein [bacterium]|nr:calcium-binding protein [bacterium]